MGAPTHEKLGTLLGKAQQQMMAEEQLYGATRFISTMATSELEQLQNMVHSHGKTPVSEYLDRLIAREKNERMANFTTPESIDDEPKAAYVNPHCGNTECRIMTNHRH